MTPVESIEREAEDLRAELYRSRDEVAFLRELVSELTGLDLTGVARLLALHRRAERIDALEFEPYEVLEALGARWWPTGVIARALLPAGGRELTARQRSSHHRKVSDLLRTLERDGWLVKRRVAEDGRVLGRDESGRGRTEWHRRGE